MVKTCFINKLFHTHGSSYSIAKLIDEKIDAFKNSLVESLTNQIKDFTDEQKREIEGFVDNKKAFFSSQVTEYVASVKVIQQHVKELKEENNNLKKSGK